MTDPTDPSRLHDEVVEVARDLIRLDTTNAREPGLGNETRCAAYLQDYLARNGVEAELVAREPHRANIVARIPGATPGADSLAFVGHTDVVPADPRDWTHPPFEAVLDDDGWLWGRGAVDMKNEVAARAVALAELARTGFRPSGDLWFLAVADEEDGFADVGMRWLLQERPDIRPTHSINEGGGERLALSDGREMLGLSVGEKGTLPVRITAVGEAGHASVPTLGRNAVPLLAQLLPRLGDGMPEPSPAPEAVAMLRALLGRDEPDLAKALVEAEALYAGLGDTIRSLMGSTLAPTMLWGSTKRNVMPARATVEVDIRILPGTTEADVEARVRALLGDDLPYELDWPEAIVEASSSPVEGVVPAAVAAFLEAEGDPGVILPTLCTGFTDSNYLRAAGGTHAYGFSPFRATPNDVLEAGYHNANERVHVDDLLLSTRFHLDLARRVLG
ncbi:MAG TPA: M20/M25/M40 family metallo-hydrolase [Nocardioides sp.]|jgi:acetylornithine deacetylase/succinyl-diaminopimelate desuccinylase-like protein|nr:M20/M25/M40 family metallo-hydrolase [Nocardioides sp.]